MTNQTETVIDQFFDAIYHSDCGRVEHWLSQGVSPNITNRDNETALLYAFLQGSGYLCRDVASTGSNL